MGPVRTAVRLVRARGRWVDSLALGASRARFVKGMASPPVTTAQAKGRNSSPSRRPKTTEMHLVGENAGYLIVVPAATSATEVTAIPRRMIATWAGHSTLVELIPTRGRTGGLIVIPTTTSTTEIAAISGGMVAAGTGHSALVELLTPLTNCTGSGPGTLIGAGAAATGWTPIRGDTPGRTFTLPLTRSPGAAP